MVFKPNDTVRFRNVYTGQSNNGVPDYPPPAVVVDYYLPDDGVESILLEFLDANGRIVKAYESSAENEEGSNEVVSDMQTSQAMVIAEQSLSMMAGMNRFRWDMTHFGAWAADAEDRYENGPMVRPGRYSVRLTVGDTTSTQSFELEVDPRVIAQGTTLADINEQVAFELQAIGLLSEIRRLEKDAAGEQSELEDRRDQLSEEEASRLIVVTDILDKVKSADIIYPQPMLSRQAAFLYNMVRRADQSPGKDAIEQFDALSAQYGTLNSAYRSGD